MTSRSTLAIVTALLLVGCGGDSTTEPRVEQDGVLYNVAGIAGEPGGGHDGSVATSSRLYWPQDLVMDAAGELIVADWNNHVIRAISTDGKIRRIMGSGLHGDDSNGPALEVNLNHPDGVAIGPDGNVYIAGWHNWKIKMCDVTTGLISSVVGSDNGFSGDGGLATEAAISLPSSVVWDRDHNMYISDQGNNRIRKIGTNGIIQTILLNIQNFLNPPLTVFMALLIPMQIIKNTLTCTLPTAIDIENHQHKKCIDQRGIAMNGRYLIVHGIQFQDDRQCRPKNPTKGYYRRNSIEPAVIPPVEAVIQHFPS